MLTSPGFFFKEANLLQQNPVGNVMWEIPAKQIQSSHYEQFLLCPQCLQKACIPGASKGVIVWEWVNPSFINC